MSKSHLKTPKNHKLTANLKIRRAPLVCFFHFLFLFFCFSQRVDSSSLLFFFSIQIFLDSNQIKIQKQGKFPRTRYCLKTLKDLNTLGIREAQ
jgi:hypothetical protein